MWRSTLTALKQYRVLVGIDYVPAKGKTPKRAEPGDIVGDLPPGVIGVWVEQRVIEPVKTGIVGESGPELICLPEGGVVV